MPKTKTVRADLISAQCLMSTQYETRKIETDLTIHFGGHTWHMPFKMVFLQAIGTQVKVKRLNENAINVIIGASSYNIGIHKTA